MDELESNFNCTVVQRPRQHVRKLTHRWPNVSAHQPSRLHWFAKSNAEDQYRDSQPGEDHRTAADDSAPGAGPVDSLRRRASSARQDSQDERQQAKSQAKKRSPEYDIQPKRIEVE